MSVVRIETRGYTDSAVDIFNTAAADTLQMMMVVVGAGFVARAAWPKWIDTPDNSVRREIVHNIVNRLQRE